MLLNILFTIIFIYLFYFYKKIFNGLIEIKEKVILFFCLNIFCGGLGIFFEVLIALFSKDMLKNLVKIYNDTLKAGTFYTMAISLLAISSGNIFSELIISDSKKSLESLNLKNRSYITLISIGLLLISAVLFSSDKTKDNFIQVLLYTVAVLITLYFFKLENTTEPAYSDQDDKNRKVKDKIDEDIDIVF